VELARPAAFAVAAPREGTAAAGLRPDTEEVFRAHYPRVVGVAARVLGSTDAAEDVAQEVFLSFARSSVPAASAAGWLSVAAVHTALNTVRTGRRRSARELAVGGPGEAVPDVADDVVAGEDRRQVREALARLPRTQAVALVLRHSGCSYAEVASATGLSPASVGTTVRRAEAALRQEMERHAPPR
jgi:RNA polymerase sigma-70 factor (ECF subfamily)